MPQETTTIAIPVALRDRIAARADLERKTQDRLADQALRRQLDVALAARDRGERLAARYLTDPRIATAGASSPTVHISKAASADARDLAAAMGDELGRNVPKGRAIQALLWAELEPLPLEAERIPLPEPPALDTLTMNVPGRLNAALLDLALRRATSREAVVDDLLATGGTAAAACRLIERLGGAVVGCSFLIRLAFLGGAAKLTGRRVSSIIAYEG